METRYPFIEYDPSGFQCVWLFAAAAKICDLKQEARSSDGHTSLAISRQLTTLFPEMLRQQSETLDFHSGVSGLCLLLEQLALLHFSPDET